jgi:cytosine/adenosine deaminase-related metal-dependent hydrolase
MATLGGAEAWGLASELGSLEPGKQALVLAVGCEERIGAASDVFEYLTTAGESVQPEWLLETGDVD